MDTGEPRIPDGTRGFEWGTRQARARLSLDAVSGDVRNSSLYSVSGLSRRDREDNDAPSLPLAGSEPALSELTLHDTAEASEEELVEEWQRYKQLAAQVEQELRARQSARAEYCKVRETLKKDWVEERSHVVDLKRRLTSDRSENAPDFQLSRALRDMDQVEDELSEVVKRTGSTNLTALVQGALGELSLNEEDPDEPDELPLSELSSEERVGALLRVQPHIPKIPDGSRGFKWTRPAGRGRAIVQVPELELGTPREVAPGSSSGGATDMAEAGWSAEPPPEDAFSLFSYILTSETDPASSTTAPESLLPDSPAVSKAALNNRRALAAELVRMEGELRNQQQLRDREKTAFSQAAARLHEGFREDKARFGAMKDLLLIKNAEHYEKKNRIVRALRDVEEVSRSLRNTWQVLDRQDPARTSIESELALNNDSNNQGGFVTPPRQRSSRLADDLSCSASPMSLEARVRRARAAAAAALSDAPPALEELFERQVPERDELLPFELLTAAQAARAAAAAALAERAPEAESPAEEEPTESERPAWERPLERPSEDDGDGASAALIAARQAAAAALAGGRPPEVEPEPETLQRAASASASMASVAPVSMGFSTQSASMQQLAPMSHESTGSQEPPPLVQQLTPYELYYPHGSVVGEQPPVASLGSQQYWSAPDLSQLQKQQLQHAQLQQMRSMPLDTFSHGAAPSELPNTAHYAAHPQYVPQPSQQPPLPPTPPPGPPPPQQPYVQPPPPQYVQQYVQQEVQYVHAPPPPLQYAAPPPIPAYYEANGKRYVAAAVQPAPPPPPPPPQQPHYVQAQEVPAYTTQWQEAAPVLQRGSSGLETYPTPQWQEAAPMLGPGSRASRSNVSLDTYTTQTAPAQPQWQEAPPAQQQWQEAPHSQPQWQEAAPALQQRESGGIETYATTQWQETTDSTAGAAGTATGEVAAAVEEAAAASQGYAAGAQPGYSSQWQEIQYVQTPQQLMEPAPTHAYYEAPASGAKFVQAPTPSPPPPSHTHVQEVPPAAHGYPPQWAETAAPAQLDTIAPAAAAAAEGMSEAATETDETAELKAQIEALQAEVQELRGAHHASADDSVALQPSDDASQGEAAAAAVATMEELRAPSMITSETYQAEQRSTEPSQQDLNEAAASAAPQYEQPPPPPQQQQPQQQQQGYTTVQYLQTPVSAQPPPPPPSFVQEGVRYYAVPEPQRYAVMHEVPPQSLAYSAAVPQSQEGGYVQYTPQPTAVPQQSYVLYHEAAAQPPQSLPMRRSPGNSQHYAPSPPPPPMAPSDGHGGAAGASQLMQPPTPPQGGYVNAPGHWQEVHYVTHTPPPPPQPQGYYETTAAAAPQYLPPLASQMDAPPPAYAAEVQQPQQGYTTVQYVQAPPPQQQVQYAMPPEFAPPSPYYETAQQQVQYETVSSAPLPPTPPQSVYQTESSQSHAPP